MNECDSDTLHNCHDNATCANANGSFTCTCKNGFSGDGVNCAGIVRMIHFKGMHYMTLIPSLLLSREKDS